MSWLNDYRKRLLARIYGEGPELGPDKLHYMWPFFLGGLIFAALDLSLDLSEQTRNALLVALLAPGVIWFVYLTFHQFVGFRRWVANRSEKDSIDG